MRRPTLLSSGGEVTRAVSRDRPPSCGISNALSLYKGGWTRNAVFVGDAGGSSSVWASPCVHHKVRQLWVFPEDYRRAPEARLQLRGIYNLIEQGLRPVPTEIGQISEFAHIHPRLEYHKHCPKSAVHLRRSLCGRTYHALGRAPRPPPLPSRYQTPPRSVHTAATHPGSGPNGYRIASPDGVRAVGTRTGHAG